jgi:hypothetical protein
MNITEFALRDIEIQINNISSKITFDRFLLDKKILFDNISHTWPYGGETLRKEIIPPKIKSQGFWLNKFLPVIFLIVWIFLLITAIMHK